MDLLLVGYMASPNPLQPWQNTITRDDSNFVQIGVLTNKQTNKQ
jgi:hypothetical protein